MSTDSPDVSIRWRSAPASDLAWVSWGDDNVAYHRPSGTTHLLNLATRNLLEEIRHAPLTTDDIVALFTPPDKTTARRVHRAEILAMLERLAHLGLVDRE